MLSLVDTDVMIDLSRVSQRPGDLDRH